MNRLPELTDWDAMPFSAAEKRRRREAERNAALRGNPDALEKRAREAARKKRQREAAEAERARKRRRKGELRVANSISSAIAAAATNKALSDAAALARYDRLLLYERVALEYLCRTATYLSIDASAASGLARAAADVDAARRASCGKLPVVAGPMCSSGRRPTIGGPLLELDDFYAEAIADGSCFYAEEAFCRDSLRFDPLRLDGVHDRLVRDRLEDMRLKDMRLKDRARCLALEERSTEQVDLETKSRRKRDAQEDKEITIDPNETIDDLVDFLMKCGHVGRNAAGKVVNWGVGKTKTGRRTYVAREFGLLGLPLPGPFKRFRSKPEVARHFGVPQEMLPKKPPTKGRVALPSKEREERRLAKEEKLREKKIESNLRATYAAIGDRKRYAIRKEAREKSRMESGLPRVSGYVKKAHRRPAPSDVECDSDSAVGDDAAGASSSPTGVTDEAFVESSSASDGVDATRANSASATTPAPAVGDDASDSDKDCDVEREPDVERESNVEIEPEDRDSDSDNEADVERDSEAESDSDADRYSDSDSDLWIF